MNKRTKAIVFISIIVSGMIFAVFLLIFPQQKSFISADTRFVSHMISAILTVVILGVAFWLNIAYIYAVRFSSIKEEIYDYKDKYPDDAHYVLTILKETERDCFVLAYFQKYNALCPAVYTVKHKRYSYLNLRVQQTYFKKIYLTDSENGEYLRVYRIKNKSTKSQMLFFAANIPINGIAADGVSVPALTEPGQFGNFTVFGIEESSKQEYTSVTVSGVVYPLEITPVSYYFIGKNEVKFD